MDANIIDIGGGDSRFVDAFHDSGYENVFLLDISAYAIERAKQRLGANALKVHGIVSGVTAFEPPVQFYFWHDRAAFHFLTTEENFYNYVSIAEGAIKKNCHLILGAFSENGPTKCGGLEIRQYAEASMSARLKWLLKELNVSMKIIPRCSISAEFLCGSFRKC